MKIALIPARSGSQRVPDKNIRLLNGNALISYTIETALNCSLIDRVVVSTDSMKYAEIAKECGAEVLSRPVNLATGNTPDTPVVEHFIQSYPEVSQIIYLRPTTPLRKYYIVNKAITQMDSLLKYSFMQFDSLRSVEEMSESAYKCFKIKGDYLEGLIGSSQNLPNHFYDATFKANGYVDIILPKTIREYGNCYGSKIKAFITENVTEVDTEREFKLLEWELNTF